LENNVSLRINWELVALFFVVFLLNVCSLDMTLDEVPLLLLGCSYSSSA
jgi:hypothetical protein